VSADIADVGRRQELVDRKGQDPFGLPFGHRKRAATMAEMRCRRLQMNRNRVVDRRLDPLAGEEFL
jgi:hypothetical protein